MKKYISSSSSISNLPVKIWMDSINYQGEVTDSTLIATFRDPNWASHFIRSLPEYENSKWTFEGISDSDVARYRAEGKASRYYDVSSSTNYKVDVVPEADDDYDQPTTWSIEMTDSEGTKHYIWIVKYDEKEYVVEDSNGNNLAKGLKYTTFAGAKKKAFEIARRQEDRDFFTN